MEKPLLDISKRRDSTMSEQQEHCVYEGAEVVKTGRIAKKQITINGKIREFELVEITPFDSDFDWKKWVRPEDLFKII